DTAANHFPVRVGHKITPTSREERVAFPVQAAACFVAIATSVQQLVKQSPAGRSEHDRAAASARSELGHRHVGMTDTDNLPFYSRQTRNGMRTTRDRPQTDRCASLKAHEGHLPTPKRPAPG